MIDSSRCAAICGDVGEARRRRGRSLTAETWEKLGGPFEEHMAELFPAPVANSTSNDTACANCTVAQAVSLEVLLRTRRTICSWRERTKPRPPPRQTRRRSRTRRTLPVDFFLNDGFLQLLD